MPASNLNVDIPGDHPEWPERMRVMQSGRLRERVLLLHEALNEGWLIQVDGLSEAARPVATWHGDPVCTAHLAMQYAESFKPRQVRMAQWGPRHG